MQREILFKAKSIEPSTFGMWFEGSLMVCGACRYILPENPLTPIGLLKHRINPKTAGQFTGMTDKNGKRIFEGDVYSMGEKNILYVVIFDKSQFIGKQVRNRSLAGLEYWKSDIEIIGNIHDNPELL